VLPAREAADYSRPERARGVHRAAGVDDREELAREEREADADGRERRRPVLLRAEHQHRQAERGGDERLDEHRLRRVHVCGRRGAGRLRSVCARGRHARDAAHLDAIGPGSSARTSPAAAMPPASWAMQ
jgi:hypothetical protein